MQKKINFYFLLILLNISGSEKGITKTSSRISKPKSFNSDDFNNLDQESLLSDDYSSETSNSRNSEVIDLENSCMKCLKPFGTSLNSYRSDLSCCKGHICYECLIANKKCPWCKKRIKNRVFYSHQDISPLLRSIKEQKLKNTAFVFDTKNYFQKPILGEVPFIDCIDCYQENACPNCPKCTIL